MVGKTYDDLDDPKHERSSVKPLVFLDNPTEDRSSWIHSEMCRVMLTAQIQKTPLTQNILKTNSGVLEAKTKP